MNDELEGLLVAAMLKHGGSFAQAIAKAWQVADSGNRAILRKAFTPLLNEYRQFL